MKKNKIVNLSLSAILLVLYTATFLIAPAAGFPMTLLDYIATAGVLLGLTVFLHPMPSPYFTAILAFAFFAQYFGMMWDFYINIWWWDIVVHFASGFLLGCMGYYLYTLLTRKSEAEAPIAVSVLFAIFFAIACAGGWEIYEFCADTFGGLSSQVDLQDTMEDIICGTASGLIYGTGLAVYLKKKRKK